MMALPPKLKAAAEAFHAFRQRPRSIDEILEDKIVPASPPKPSKKLTRRVRYSDPKTGRAWWVDEQ